MHRAVETESARKSGFLSICKDPLISGSWTIYRWLCVWGRVCEAWSMLSCRSYLCNVRRCVCVWVRGNTEFQKRTFWTCHILWGLLLWHPGFVVIYVHIEFLTLSNPFWRRKRKLKGWGDGMQSQWRSKDWVWFREYSTVCSVLVWGDCRLHHCCGWTMRLNTFYRSNAPQFYWAGLSPRNTLIASTLVNDVVHSTQYRWASTDTCQSALALGSQASVQQREFRRFST